MHVLGTPPAFVLSQDQTLHRKFNSALTNTPRSEVLGIVLFWCPQRAGRKQSSPRGPLENPNLDCQSAVSAITSQPSLSTYGILSVPSTPPPPPQPTIPPIRTRPRTLSQPREYASGRNRTFNLGIKSPLLCQLSYGRLSRRAAVRPAAPATCKGVSEGARTPDLRSHSPAL